MRKLIRLYYPLSVDELGLLPNMDHFLALKRLMGHTYAQKASLLISKSCQDMISMNY